jgi:uncharacterized protein
MNLLPREEKFFALFLNQVKIISQAARLLMDGTRAGNSELLNSNTKICQLEREGDEIIHDVFRRLNQTFITPIDPEDIHSIASRLDDVLDGIEDAAHRITAYRLEPIPPTVLKLCEIVYDCSVAFQTAFEALSHSKPFLESCIEINRLEDSADQLMRQAVADLFRTEKDPIALIKLREVYDVLEETIDRCEDVADVLQNVQVKNS